MTEPEILKQTVIDTDAVPAEVTERTLDEFVDKLVERLRSERPRGVICAIMTENGDVVTSLTGRPPDMLGIIGSILDGMKRYGRSLDEAVSDAD